MSGIIDKLKDVGKDALGTFVVLEDEDGAPAGGDHTVPAPAAPAPPGAPARAAAAAPAIAVPAVAAAADPEFVQQLQAAVDGSRRPELAQFRALFAALSAVPDEATRTQLALSAAQASHGFGAAQVAEAVDDRLRILAGEQQAFRKAVEDENAQSVGATQAETEKTRAEITRRIEEIKALEQKAAELDRSAREAKATIDANSARFDASYAAVEGALTAERARIAPFLNPAR